MPFKNLYFYVILWYVTRQCITVGEAYITVTKNIPLIEHKVYVSLTICWMCGNSDVSCCDLPSPLIQHEKSSTLTVKRTLECEILAINYVGIEMTCNLSAYNSLAISSYLFLSNYIIPLYMKRWQEFLWVSTDVSPFGLQNEEMYFCFFKRSNSLNQ